MDRLPRSHLGVLSPLAVLAMGPPGGVHAGADLGLPTYATGRGSWTPVRQARPRIAGSVDP